MIQLFGRSRPILIERNCCRHGGLLPSDDIEPLWKMERNMARRFALSWALISFVLTIVQGVFLSVGFDATMRAALLSLIVVYGLGLMCGKIWQEAFE